MQRGLRRLREGHEADPWGASKRFMQDVVGPFRRESGAATWVEMTPPNAKAADTLCRMFPRARIVHMVRDGRDVAASVARRTWGPNDIESALRGGRTTLSRSTQRCARRSCTGADGPTRGAGRFRREEHFAALIDFLGRAPDPGMRKFFDQEFTSQERSHSGSGVWDSMSLIRSGSTSSTTSSSRLERQGAAVPPAS